ncbi:MAG TPA: hypothetical protein VE640_02875 [Candidatus Bathyarchaeia archaeon]|nr:hypothetical protein [Candidatus Bathyarchaeia archaeon]
MNVALAVIAGVAVAGAVLAVSAREVRATVLGILIVFLATPLVASPWPGPLAILARVAAALLAARLMMIGLRGETVSGGTRIGWPAEALAAAAAAVVGYGSHGLGAPALGPAEAQATGFALVALAVTPLATGRDVFRLGVGAVLLVMGALLIRVGLDTPPTEGEQIVVSLLTIGLGGAIGVIAAAARAAGGLEIANIPSEWRGPRPPDAHRAAATVTAAPPSGSSRPSGSSGSRPPRAGGSARRPRLGRSPSPPTREPDAGES